LAKKYDKYIHPMIETNHSKWADRIFQFYILRLMRKHFYSINILGEVPILPSGSPILLLPNHSTWWDGFFIYLMNLKFFQRPLYLMMLEEQLSKYKFFSRVGAYSIDLNNSKGVIQSLKYTLKILKQTVEPAPLVCIFPQGEMFPPGKRPIRAKSGYQWIINHLDRDIITLPLGIRIEYLDQQFPEVFFQLGKPVVDSKKLDSAAIEMRLTDILDSMLDLISAKNRGSVLLSGKISVSEQWGRFMDTFKSGK
jgi:chlorobactene lauroyltransferase